MKVSFDVCKKIDHIIFALLHTSVFMYPPWLAILVVQIKSYFPGTGWMAQTASSRPICAILCHVIAILQSSAQLSIINNWEKKTGEKWFVSLTHYHYTEFTRILFPEHSFIYSTHFPMNCYLGSLSIFNPISPKIATEKIFIPFITSLYIDIPETPNRQNSSEFRFKKTTPIVPTTHVQLKCHICRMRSIIKIFNTFTCTSKAW